MGWSVRTEGDIDRYELDFLLVEAWFDRLGRVVQAARWGDDWLLGYVPRYAVDKRESLIEWLTEPVSGGAR